MSEVRTDPLVWVKDSAGNGFLCPMDALRDPKSVSEEEKVHCIVWMTLKSYESEKRPRRGKKLKFSESNSPS